MEPSNTLIMHDLYANAFYNTLHSYRDNQGQDIKPFIKKMIVYGESSKFEKKLEYITQEEAERDFQYAETIKSFMGSLTPIEFINIFPIDKNFKGHKYECKDYFYTRDYVNGLDPRSPIGKEIDDLLWEFTNREIRMFNVG